MTKNQKSRNQTRAECSPGRIDFRNRCKRKVDNNTDVPRGVPIHRHAEGAWTERNGKQDQQRNASNEIHTKERPTFFSTDHADSVKRRWLGAFPLVVRVETALYWLSTCTTGTVTTTGGLTRAAEFSA